MERAAGETAPKKQPDTFDSVLQEWANARGATTIVICTGDDSLNFDDHVMAVWAELFDLHDRIDLVIDSQGGDPHSAYQIVELLRRHLKVPKEGLTAVVPFRAASAATLLCLGCDAIMLDELARLGPLDMQVYESLKGGRGRYKSALNQHIALQELAEHSLAHLRAAKRALVRDRVLPDEAYEIASKLTIGLFQPMYGQINPERLAELKRANDVMRAYARCLLQRYSKLGQAEQWELVEKLVAGYPSHGYFIDMHEAEDLALPVIQVPENLETLAIRLLTQVRIAEAGVYLKEPQVRDSTAVAAEPARPRRRRKKQSGPPKSPKALSSPAAREHVHQNGRRR